MVKLVYFSCILVFVLLESAESISNYLVIGGVPVRPGQFPFLVSIQYNGIHKCGGSIISPMVILTAAHCLDRRDVKYISVVAGTPDLESGGERIPASRIKWHGDFNRRKMDSDVGLVFLSSPLNYSATIQQTELPDPSEDFHNSTKTVTVVGWGAAIKGSLELDTTARYTGNPLWGRKECLKRVPYLTLNMICGGTYDGQKNACPGDSGGPVLIGNKTIGIVSWGYSCGKYGRPVVYASVTNLLPWINANRVVQNNS